MIYVMTLAMGGLTAINWSRYRRLRKPDRAETQLMNTLWFGSAAGVILSLLFATGTL